MSELLQQCGTASCRKLQVAAWPVLDVQNCKTMITSLGLWSQIARGSGQSIRCPCSDQQAGQLTAVHGGAGYEADVDSAADNLQYCAMHPDLPAAMINRELSQLEVIDCLLRHVCTCLQSVGEGPCMPALHLLMHVCLASATRAWP